MFQVLVILDVRNVEALRRFETAAMQVVADYSGRLVTAFESGSRSESSDSCEIHLLQFPAEEDFNAYRGDPRLDALSELREEAIRSTKLYPSRQFRNYQ